MTCPDNTHLRELLEGRGPAHERRRLDAHLAGCPFCRSAVLELGLEKSLSGTPGGTFLRASGPLTASQTVCEPWGPSTGATLQEDEPRHTGEEAPQSELSPLDTGRQYVVLSHIGSGGMGHVYRAFDRLAGRVVALKHVRVRRSAQGQEAPASQLEALAQEFRTLSTVRHPNIISVLDYRLRAGAPPFFTMELLHDAEPLLPFGASAPLEAQLDLLAQLLRALAYLHRRGILHRDLKPSNILVVRAPPGGGGPILKVLDFGLSTGTADVFRHRPAGTLPYMAPELLRGGPAEEASDVYAAGIIACQMLAGRHPFAPSGGPQELVRKVLTTAPDLGALGSPLRDIIASMLARSPADRPAPAALVRALCETAGAKLPSEPVPVRESYLVSARLVGRESELDALDGALADARQGRGSAWLLGGESGAGKSRLLDELRTRALVQGVLVARGQAAPDDRSAYSLWRSVLPILALHGDLDDADAGVLGTLVSGLDVLLGRDVPPPPEIEPAAARSRLLRALIALVEQAPGPVLLILEDLQWADAESLELLAQVSRRAADRPLLVAASYRRDEAPRLPSALPHMRPLAIERLDRASVARLCESMLGPAGANPKIVDLLARESEGNAYFLVEGVRALAEDSGGLDEVGRGGLPERILAGGVERVLDRRLSRVPPEARAMLRLAAVAGRQLDLEVLSRLEPALSDLVLACADAGVLAVREQRWAFDHDKLRERLLGGVAPAELRVLHGQMADGLLSVHGSSGAEAARIAHHLREAGRFVEAGRFFALAGETALGRGAPGEAETMLEKAIALHQPASGSRPDLWGARLFRRLAQARFALGQLRGTDEALRRLCEVAGAPLPVTRHGLWLALASQLAEMVAHRSGLLHRLPPWLRDLAKRGRRSAQDRTTTPAESRALGEELLLGMAVGEVYIWLAQPQVCLLCAVWGLNLEEALSARQGTASTAGFAYILSHTPLWPLGQHYMAEAARLAPPGSRAEIDQARMQSMISLHLGRRAEGLSIAERAVEMARGGGDDVVWLHSLFQLQLAVVATEDFPRVRDLCVEMERLAVRTGNPRYLVLALLGQGTAHVMLGDLDLAEAALDRCLELASVHELGPPLLAVMSAVAAYTALEAGLPEVAEERAGAAMVSIARTGWPMEELRFALFCVLSVYLGLDASGPRAERVEQGLGILHALARRFASAKPSAWLFEGRRRLRDGDLAGANRALRRSLRAAERVGSLLEQAYAREWLGRLGELPPGRAQVPEGSTAHFEAALQLYERLKLTSRAARLPAHVVERAGRGERRRPLAG